MGRNGISSKLPQYVLISYFKLNFPYYNLAPLLLPLPSFVMRKISFHLVHSISTHIYSYFSPKSSWHKAERVQFSHCFLRVLFWEHCIILVAPHWASLGMSLWGNLFQIAPLMEENSRREKMLSQHWVLAWLFIPSGVLLSLMDCCGWSFTILPPRIKKIKFN